MTEAARPLVDDAITGNDASRHKSAGAMLRRAREEAGLHIGAMAVSLKVPVKKLEALEADRLDLLPDAVFARALAGTVCRMLKIDPVPVLAAFPQTKAQKDQAEKAARQPTFRPSGHSSQKSLMERLSRPFILLGLAFAIGALALMFFPTIQLLIDDIKKGLEASSAPGIQPSVAQAPSTEPALGAGSVSVLVPGAQVAATATAPLAVASEPMAALAQGIAESSVILMLTARGSSWVEVTDAARVVVLRKTMVAGESQTLGGALPMTVILGRANLLDVQVRGSALDLAPVTKDNVARFEVK